MSDIQSCHFRMPHVEIPPSHCRSVYSPGFKESCRMSGAIGFHTTQSKGSILCWHSMMSTGCS